MNPRYPIAASDRDLRQLFSFLREHHIALATGMAMVTGNDCGFNVEGMTLQGTPRAIAARIKKLGGDLRYVAMDEPLMFAHEYSGKNACVLSIPQVARSVAENVRDIRAVFPGVQIVDSEPVEHFGGNWRSEVEQWLDAYQAALGEYPVAFQDDPFWDGPWRKRIPDLNRMLVSRGIAFGIMFVAGRPGDSDADWVGTAKTHIMEFRSEFPNLDPQQAIFTTWNPYPTHVLPEDAPLSLTGLVSWYLRLVPGTR